MQKRYLLSLCAILSLFIGLLAFSSCDKKDNNPDSSEHNKLIGKWGLHTGISQSIKNGDIVSSDTFGISGDAYLQFITDSTGRGAHYGILTEYSNNEVDFTYSVTNDNRLYLTADTMHSDLQILNLSDNSLTLLQIYQFEPDSSGSDRALHTIYIYSRQ